MHRTLLALPRGEFLASAVTVLIVLSVLVGRARRPYGAPVWVLAAILTPLAGLISGASSSVGASFRSSLTLAVLVGLAPFVLRYLFVESPRVIRSSVFLFLSVQSMSALAGVGQAAFGLEIAGNIARDGRANGLAGHPNVLAIMSVIAILLSVWLAVGSRTGIARWGGILTLAVNIVSLFATGALSALLALAVGLVAMLLLRPALWRKVLAAMVLSAPVMFVAILAGVDISAAFTGTQERIADVTGEVDGRGSWLVRLATWEMGWERIQDSPLLGWGMDGANSAVYGNTVVHNVVLRAWYQGGLLYFVVVALITITILAIALSPRLGVYKPLSAAVALAVWTFALTSAFYNETHYWLPLACAIAALDTNSSKRSLKR